MLGQSRGGLILPFELRVAPNPDRQAPAFWSSVLAMDDASFRVSDAEREHAVIVLREHLLAGRLTLEEFSERVEAALRARVGGELEAVQEDLPQVFGEASRS